MKILIFSLSYSYAASSAHHFFLLLQVFITHSMPSCTDRAFHTGLYHPLSAVLYRQSISHRSVSPTQCRPAKTEHFTEVCITHSMPSCTASSSVNSTKQTNALTHSIITSTTQTEHFTLVFLAHSIITSTTHTEHFTLVFLTHLIITSTTQTEHFMLVCITHSIVTSTTQSISHWSVSPTQSSLAQHRQSISHRSLSPTQCHPAQHNTEHFTQIFLTHSMPSCTASSFITSATQTEQFTVS